MNFPPGFMLLKIKEHPGVLLVCILFFVAGLLRLNDLSLYTDSTRYVIWGNSVAHGKGFVDNTQPEAERYVVNAPLYSVVIAPVLLVFPSSMIAAKVWTLLWGVCALVLFYSWLLRERGKTTALAGVTLLAFNPLMLVISTEALSEAPFLSALFGAMILFDRFTGEERPSRAVFLGTLVLFSVVVLLREVAIAVVGAAFVALLLKKKPGRALLVVGCAAALYGLWLVRNLLMVGETPSSQSANIHFILQHVVTPSTASIFREFVIRIWMNLRGFADLIAGMLFFPFPPNLIAEPSSFFKAILKGLELARPVIFVVASSIMLSGIRSDFSRSAGSLFRLIFTFLYLVIVLLYPIHDIRFLLPLLPLMIFYALCGLSWLKERIPGLRGIDVRWVSAAFGLLVVIPNVVCFIEIVRTNRAYQTDPEQFYSKTPPSSASRAYFSQPWTLMGSWIGSHLPPNAVIASSTKEIATFVGERKVLEINNGVPLPLFDELLRDNGADFVLAPGLWENFRSFEFNMRESRRFWFEPVFQASNLSLYKIHSRLRGPSSSTYHEDAGNDSSTAAGLLRLGRAELVSEHYEEAIQLLQRAYRLEPNQPAVFFQLLIAYSIIGDSTTATKLLQVMFTTNRSTPYLWTSQAYLYTMNSLAEARRMKYAGQQSVQMLQAARSYWDLGCERRAYSLAKEVTRIDTAYFVGLLWGWHYAIQLGDTGRARYYLRALEGIDRGNAVVTSFRTMTHISDTLRRTSVSRARSRLRLAIATEYDKVDLPETALDETERSIGEDGANVPSLMFLAQLFEKNKKQLGAKKVYQQVLELDPGNATARTHLTNVAFLSK